MDLSTVQKRPVDILLEVEAAPIPCGVLIGNIAEDVDIYGPGLVSAGWKTPAEVYFDRKLMRTGASRSC